ncbi:Transmembrane protein [Gossypium arboreum]|uniref:Transmembrane protein n=1 Tax=Gossypium arboreum TaxID=29729 RepID=A0A0B0PZG1_GOSAR|nr:Transmembrane protein [Gossypium arboreum]
MSPSADGTVKCACRCSSSSLENGGFNDDSADYGHLSSVDGTCSHCAGSKPSSNSSSALAIGTVPLTQSEKLRRFIVASAKGFSIGAGLRGGLALFSIIARLRRKKLRKDESFSDKEAIVVVMKETIRYGLFLGTFAGPSMLLTGPNKQHKSLAIYIFMRAAVLASRCGMKSKRFGKLCKPLTWKHGDIFLMCLSSSQILSSYLLKPESFPPSYRSFLNKHVGKDQVILQGVKEHASALPYTNLEAIEKFFKAKGADVKLDPNMKIPCSALHNIREESSWYNQIKLIFICLYRICLFPTGLALAIEKKSRRIEISLYCLARAIESLFTCMADVGYLPKSMYLKRADVVIFSLSTAIIMHCYAQEREVFRSKYLSVLDWVFGVPPPPCETPPCKNR